MAADPGASKRVLMMRAKSSLTLLRKGSDAGAHIWAAAVAALSSETMKFVLNAATDTLPHNANLALWRGLNDSCRLCGHRQTLSNVLNHCEVALNLPSPQPSPRYHPRNYGLILLSQPSTWLSD